MNRTPKSLINWTLSLICVIIAVLCPNHKIVGQELGLAPKSVVDCQIREIECSELHRGNEALRLILKDKRIVCIGENRHDDGSTINAKNELIRYLHEELGFNVLLIEISDLDLIKAKEYRQTGLRLDQSVSKTLISSRLTAADSVLYAFIESSEETKMPMKLHGIDICSSLDIVDVLRPRISSLDSNLLDVSWWLAFEKSFSRNALIYKSEKLSDLIRIADEMMGNVDSLNSTNGSPIGNWKELKIAIRSYIECWHLAYYKFENKIKKPSFSSYYIRDKRMAEVASWYIDEVYPQEKIIISTSSYHITRNVDQIKTRKKDIVNSHPMGEYLSEEYGEDMYSIAFLAYAGQGGKIGQYTYDLPRPKKSSIETYLHNTGYSCAFLDFNNCGREIPWVTNFFWMHPTFKKNYKGRWSEIYDGVFFIDQMKPHEMINYYGDWFFE